MTSIISSVIGAGLFNHRIRSACKLLAIAATLAVLYGCEGGVSGGEQTMVDLSIELTGATLRVNNISGSDFADGINQPYQTLQHALNQLRPGDVLVIEDTDQPYSTSAIVDQERNALGELVRTLRGFKLSTSGTQSAPIVIEGRGMSRPEINQMQSSSALPNTSMSADATVGLLLDCVSHVVVRNLEIHSVNEAGITTATDGACQTTNIVIEGNHIHHIYGEKYVGGIRMMGVSDVIIRGNHIHEVFSNASPEAKPLIKNGRGINNVIVENNRLELLETGIAFNAQGVGDSVFALNASEPVSAIQVKNNVFDTVSEALNFTTHISDAASIDEQKTGLFAHIDVFGNIFERLGSAALISAGGSQNQSHDVCVYNNSIINVTAPVLDVSGVTALEVFNNILAMPQGEILLTRAPANTALINSIAYLDYNLFYDFVSLRWRLDVDGLTEALYPDLPSWQVAATHPELASNPDWSAIIGSPQFVDASNGDYTLDASSPAIDTGRFGLSIGADFSLPAPVARPTFPCAERALN